VTDAPEPAVELDEYVRDYLLLQATKKERDRLDAEYNRLRNEFIARIGKNHIATIAGQEVFTNKPTAAFRGKEFAADHPLLAKEFTRTVAKPELDVDALKAAHPNIWREYQSRQFRIVNVE
jgi:hypothetical protein